MSRQDGAPKYQQLPVPWAHSEGCALPSIAVLTWLAQRLRYLTGSCFSYRNLRSVRARPAPGLCFGASWLAGSGNPVGGSQPIILVSLLLASLQASLLLCTAMCLLLMQVSLREVSFDTDI